MTINYRPNNRKPFADTISGYSNEKLLTIVKSPEEYSRLLIDACKEEIEKRGLDMPTYHIIPDEKIFLYLTNTRNKLSQGATDEECENYLIQAGLNREQSQRIIKKAKIPTPKYLTNHDVDSSDYSIWDISTIVLLISLTVRIFFYLYSL